MRVLYLLDEFPYPPDTGDRISMFQLIRRMSNRHECSLLSFAWEGGVGREIEFRGVLPNVRILGIFPVWRGLSLQVRRVKRLLRGDPVSLARADNTAFRGALSRTLCAENYDLIHLKGFTIAPYLPLCCSRPTVLSPVDAISLRYARRAECASGLRKVYLNLAARSIKRLERSLFPLASSVHLVSPADSEYMRAVAPGARIDVIPQALTDEVLAHAKAEIRVPPGPPRLVFTLPLRNPDMANPLLRLLEVACPAVLDTFPGAQMLVLGRHASPSVARAIGRMRNVRMLTWVDNYCGELAAADVVVLPDPSGTGIKNRVLTSMALAKPIVGSPFALEGIPVEDGTQCFVCRTPKEFLERTVQLLHDGELRARMGLAARRLALKNYAPDVVGERWDKLYEIAAARGTEKAVPGPCLQQ